MTSLILLSINLLLPVLRSQPLNRLLPLTPAPSLSSNDNLLQKPPLLLLVTYGLEAIRRAVKLSVSLLLAQTFLPADYPIKKTQVTLSAGCRTLLMKMNQVS